MTPLDFTIQISRLQEAYGKQAYGTERTKLIWREVMHQERAWFEAVVDKFIAEMKQAPLVPEFRDEVNRERDRKYQIEKSGHTNEIKKIVATFPQDDIGSICQAIAQKLRGEMTDDSYKSVVTNIKHASEVAHVRQCLNCDNTGAVWTKSGRYESVSKCYCEEAKKKRNAWPTAK